MQAWFVLFFLLLARLFQLQLFLMLQLQLFRFEQAIVQFGVLALWFELHEPFVFLQANVFRFLSLR